MAWPLSWILRPLIRSISWFLGAGYSREEAAAHMEAPPHFHTPEQVAQALPEAVRGRYFADFIRRHEGMRDFGQMWFAASRAAWYEAYGRAPTAEERAWAYSRPQDMLGLRVEVTGRGAWSGQERRISITVNAPWTASYGDVVNAVTDYFSSAAIGMLLQGSEPIDLDTMQMAIEGGALLERQNPTITM